MTIVKTTKAYEKMIMKAESDLNKECSRQLDLVNCSAIITLYEEYGWRTDRISKLLFVSQDKWQECAESNSYSMLSLLDDYTGIEMVNDEGKSYKEVIYLNAEIDKGKPLNTPQWLRMRQNQKKWIKAQITACLFIALHEKEGWGFERLSRLATEMEEIKEEYRYNNKALCKACMERAKYDWSGLDEVKRNGSN